MMNNNALVAGIERPKNLGLSSLDPFSSLNEVMMTRFNKIAVNVSKLAHSELYSTIPLPTSGKHCLSL